MKVDRNIPPVQHPSRQVPVQLLAAYLSNIKKLKVEAIILHPEDLSEAVKHKLYYVRVILV